MKHIVAHLELWLSAAGLIVIAVVPLVLGLHHAMIWPAVAITATVIGALHGMIFWLVRRRQRLLRQQALNEVRLMLKDQINNRLGLLLLHLGAAHTPDTRETIGEIQAALSTISMLLDTVSDETLRTWTAHYRPALTKH